MAFSPEFLDELRGRVGLADVVGRRVRLIRKGREHSGLCPFHNEKTPSFTLNEEKGFYHCFGCGAHGSAIDFVMNIEGLGFREAVERLAEQVGMEIPAETPQARERDEKRKTLYQVMEAAAAYFERCLRMPESRAAMDYLKGRGLDDATIKHFRLGFAPDSRNGLKSALVREGFPEALLATGGLIIAPDDASRSSYDRFRGRVMFPICNDTGEVIAFSGRVLNAEQSPAKYVNSPETMLFKKGDVLFGLHKSKRALIAKKQAIVCEGQVDLITAFEAGVQNVIAPQGTAFTERQARILKRYVDEVVLCFDSDAAGEKAAERSLPQLLSQNLLVRCAEMPVGEDPDSMIRSRGGEAFAAVIAESRDFFDYQLERNAKKPDFATPRGKIAVARKMAEFIARIPDAVARETVLNNTSTRLEVAPDQLRTLLKRPPSRPRSEEDEILDAQAVEVVALDQTQQWLTLLLLRSPVARAWVQGQSWSRVLDDGTPGCALLVKILESDFRADDPASVNTFLSSLDAGDEATLSSLLDRRLPEDCKSFAEDCWHDLERRDIARRRDALKAQSHSPGLGIEQLAEINTRLIELQRQLAAIPPPGNPRALE